jgi:hypothetical protein
VRLVQNWVQQQTVDFDAPVVADQAKLTELVHKVTDARSIDSSRLASNSSADLPGENGRNRGFLS